MRIETENELGLAGRVVIDVCADLRKQALKKPLTEGDLQCYELNALESMRSDFKSRSAAEHQRQ